MEVNKESMFDSIRRPISLFMRKNDTKGDGEKEAIRTQGNPNKEPVAEAMTRKNFYAVLALVKKDISKEQVRVCAFLYSIYDGLY